MISIQLGTASNAEPISEVTSISMSLFKGSFKSSFGLLFVSDTLLSAKERRGHQFCTGLMQFSWRNEIFVILVQLW
jgi:hypothetical protein